jgi:hypothetical protein
VSGLDALISSHCGTPTYLVQQCSCIEEKKAPRGRRMKSSPVDLGLPTVDLAPMEGSKAGDLEGSHRVISDRAAIGI